jgi:hypothetical protein
VQFAQLLPPDLEIHELTITRPTLHDIFVQVAQGGVEHAEHLEDSPLGNYA